MSDIVNPIGRVLPGYAGPSAVTGVVNDPPRGLTNLATGTIIKGTVLGRGQDGLTAIATDKGTINVATNAQLPAGSSVTLEVRNAGDRLQVLVLSVDTSNARQPATSTPPSGTGTVAPTGAGAAGTPAGGAVATGASGNTTSQPGANPPPAIEFVGSSVPAIVVQNSSTASLLPTPEAGVQPFVAPTAPITVPAEAIQKAQLLAQTLQLIDPLMVGDSSGTTSPSGMLAAVSPLAAPPLPTPAPGHVNVTPATLGTLLAASALASEAASPTPGNPTPLNPAAVSPSQPALPSEVAQRIMALFAAETAASPSPSTATAAPAIQIQAVITGANASVKAAPLLNLPSGTELTLHVIAVLPNQGGAIEIAPEAARLESKVAPVIGTVLGYTRADQPVVQTPAGTLMIQQRMRLPVGAQIALAIEPAAPAPMAALFPVSTPQQALLQLSNGWPTLDDLISVLRSAAGGATAETPPPPPGIPQTGPKLAAGLANAIGAFRSGEIETLLGPLLAVRKPGETKDEAVKRLRQEFSQLSELAQDRPAVDWRALFLPVYDERAGLTQINLYYRRGGSDDSEKDRGTRFLVEVNFAALGAFQLDGLMRGKRFDLMIRSRRGLLPGQRRDIQGIFEEALAIVGGAGVLEFRTVETFPVSPLDELRQSHDRLTA